MSDLSESSSAISTETELTMEIPSSIDDINIDSSTPTSKKLAPRLNLPEEMKNHLGDVNSGTYTRVHLRVHAELRFGEELHCSGASYTMGQYNPSESIQLVTSPNDYPIWSTIKPLILPRGIDHKYIYAVFSGGVFTNWEPIDCDRQIIPKGRDMTIVEDFGIYDQNTILELKNSNLKNSIYIRTIKNNEKKMIEEKKNIKRSKSFQRFQRTKKNIQSRHIPSQYKPNDMESILFLVCYHLPIDIKKNKNGKWIAKWNQDSLIARSNESIAESMKVKWIGCVPTIYNNIQMSLNDLNEIKFILLKMNAYPVFISSELSQRHYQGYCKSKLWPMFHNVDILDIYSSVWEEDMTHSNESWWNAYQQVNQSLANAVAIESKSNDIIWVHDYHLLLFPKMIEKWYEKNRLNEKRPRMIFFLHVPFPTSEIFRELSHGTILLEGVLAVDVVGFHTFDHARHFLNACKRFLGLTYQSQSGVNLGVDYNGRNVVITISHVGIEKGLIQEAVHFPDVIAAAQKLREKHNGKVLIGGIDPCQRLSGIPLKLLAFEQFFNQCPAWKDKLVLVQRVFSSSSRCGDEKYSKNEINELVTRITNSHGCQVIDYFESEKPFDLKERLALWLACDILMVTSIRGGLNLYPLEFVYAKGANGEKKAGVVLLSEFSACCCILNGGLRINPWNITEVVNSLDRAIHMNQEERIGRRARDLPYITNQPASNWTKQVLKILQESMDEIDENVLDFRLLDQIQIKKAYQNSKRRLFLVDYGGTLISRESMPMYMKKDFTAVSGKVPSKKMLDALNRLCMDPKNSVFVVSGVSQVNLTQVLGHIPTLGIAAHNGALFSWAKSIRFDTSNEDVQGDDVLKRSWYHHRLNDFDWGPVRELVDPILKTYCSRTNGSVIRYMDQGIAWNFRSCDPEWGQLQANSLQIDLDDILKDFSVSIVRKKGLLEIVPDGLNKGIVARHILDNDARIHECHPDFLFCIGDDTTDESMFKTIYEYYAEKSDENGKTIDSLQHVFTCTVGKKPSNAHLYLNNVEQVEDLFYILGNNE